MPSGHAGDGIASHLLDYTEQVTSVDRLHVAITPAFREAAWLHIEIRVETEDRRRLLVFAGLDPGMVTMKSLTAAANELAAASTTATRRRCFVARWAAITSTPAALSALIFDAS